MSIWSIPAPSTYIINILIEKKVWIKIKKLEVKFFFFEKKDIFVNFLKFIRDFHSNLNFETKIRERQT